VNSSAKLLGGIYPFARMRLFVFCADADEDDADEDDADDDVTDEDVDDDGGLSAVVLPPPADISSKYRNKG